MGNFDASSYNDQYTSVRSSMDTLNLHAQELVAGIYFSQGM